MAALRGLGTWIYIYGFLSVLLWALGYIWVLGFTRESWVGILGARSLSLLVAVWLMYMQYARIPDERVWLSLTSVAAAALSAYMLYHMFETETICSEDIENLLDWCNSHVTARRTLIVYQVFVVIADVSSIVLAVLYIVNVGRTPANPRFKGE